MSTRAQNLPPRYSHAERIGVGGMGEIYRATDDELGRTVAVKVLAERYAEDTDLRERFKREALAVARLSGEPNIVTIFDVGEHNGRPIIVMEYLAGGSLDDRMRGKAPCKTNQVLDWLEQAANALDSAHRAGIVHRDVKPGNLLLDARDHVYVADFGIASAAGMDSFTKTGTIMGTAGYLSPEQAKGERARAASDLYALAVVAFELLTGKRPYEADSPTAEAAAHIHAPIPSVSALNSDVPSQVDDIFRRALAKEPDERYGTGAELVASLRQALHDAAGKTGSLQAADVWPQPARAPDSFAPVPVARRSSARLWVPLLLVLLAGGTLAAVLLTRRDQTPTPTRAVPKPRTVRVVKTVTQQGTTLRQTVTAQAPPPPTTTTTTASTTTASTATSAAPNGGSSTALVDRSTALLRGGDYAGALPLAESALAQLQNTGETYEAYASFNTAYARFALGRCDGVLALLDRSQQVQGHRSEIDKLRKQAEKTC